MPEKRGETRPQNVKLPKLPRDPRPGAPKDKRDENKQGETRG